MPLKLYFSCGHRRLFFVVLLGVSLDAELGNMGLCVAIERVPVGMVVFSQIFLQQNHIRLAQFEGIGEKVDAFLCALVPGLQVVVTKNASVRAAASPAVMASETL